MLADEVHRGALLNSRELLLKGLRHVRGFTDSEDSKRTYKSEGLFTLTTRSDFLAANRGERVVAPSFILLVHPRRDESPRMGIGLTVSKKVGNAVARNRVKRRLRALVQRLLPSDGIAGANHVIIARADAKTNAQANAQATKATKRQEPPFARLEQELHRALDRARQRVANPRANRMSAPHRYTANPRHSRRAHSKQSKESHR